MAGYRPSFQTINSLQAALGSFRESLQATSIRIREASPRSRQIQLRDTENPLLEQVLTSATERLRLLYIILPIKHTTLYNQIKQIYDIKVRLINICSVRNKLINSAGRLQYFGNVALKFNLKGGGHNQLVEPSHLHFISRGDTIIIGINVTHPSPNSSS